MNSIKFMLTLINELNKREFLAFPQKQDPKRITLSVKGDDGNRYFLTRMANGLNPDGSARYQWARGNAMQPQTPQA
jgi:hypothetical protein